MTHLVSIDIRIPTSVAPAGPEATRMTPSTRVYLDLPPRLSLRGPRYSVRLGAVAGEIIVSDSLVPFCDAARELLVRGIKGQIELWVTARPYPRMRGDIAKLANLTVEENERAGPRIGRWRPFAGRREASKTADLPSWLPKHPSTQSAAGEREAAI